MRFCVHCKKPIRWFRTVVDGCCGKWIALDLDGSRHKHVFPAESEAL